jgi:hypothetical protein
MEAIVAWAAVNYTPIVVIGGLVECREFTTWVMTFEYLRGWINKEVMLYSDSAAFTPFRGYTFGQGLLTFICPWRLKYNVCPPISCVSWMPIAHVSIVPSKELRGVVLPYYFSLSDTSDAASCGPSTRKGVPLLGYDPVKGFLEGTL